MTNQIRQIIAIMCLFASVVAKAQPVKDVFSNSGIWEDYGTPISAATYPEFKGRLVNCNWSDIEIAPNVWDWTVFDQDIIDHTADNMPVIFLVYTRMNAPDWIFSNGVPKVNETDNNGLSVGYSPYYLDSDYNVYFKRMITQVRQHVQSMDASIRSKIIGVQACFGSTGDQIAYKGNVAKQYEISDNQFDSLFKVYSLYYYNEYKDVTPKIIMLSNPNNNKPDEQYWLRDYCPGGWTKCGTMAKGSQQNLELDKQSWLYDLLNKPQNGQYVKARSEIVGQQLYSGWWTNNKYKEMFATMCYDIYWGMDWPNQTAANIQDPKFDSAFTFFNKYATQKVAGVAQNAVCALKDALDASDSVRFPASEYGPVISTNQNRFTNIYKAFMTYGAKLEDVNAVLGNEYQSLAANGTNDVGWHLLPGNYERFLHQIDANVTSAGYWNVDDAHKDVMFGRFCRGFDVAKNKNALYFDVEDAFFRNVPLNGDYPVTVSVTYYDNGTGSWKLFYDSKTNADQPLSNIVCTDSKTWKKATFVLTDARFGNNATRKSDFYIKNSGSSNVIFSVVELSRAQQPAAGFVTTSLDSFSTVCQNTAIGSKSFVINAASLDGSAVTVGPLNGFTFSSTDSGTYTNTLTLTNYGTDLNYTIYVKMNTLSEGAYTGGIPVSGGGASQVLVNAKGTVINTSPALNAKVNTISCYNKKDGSIDLQPQGGTGPFTYKWSNDIQKSWSASTQDLSDLKVANYTVTVTSFNGCSTSKTFNITQPDVLVTSVSQDSGIVCKGGSTTVLVSAVGGTKPYSGTGTFVVPAGFKTYNVTDARGCVDPQGYKVEAGTVAAPNKPSINGPSPVTNKQKNIVYQVANAIKDNIYIWTVPQDAVIVSGQNTANVTVSWGSTAGNVTVQAQNKCGLSNTATKMIRVSNGLNAYAATFPGTDIVTEGMVLMPNPVQDVATLRFNADKAWAYSVKITDVSGKLLLEKRGTATQGTNIERLNVQNLTNGVYLVTVVNDAGEKRTVKMVKD